MKESGSEHSTHSLNARLLRFRSQPGSEDPYLLAEDLIAAKRYGDARGVAVSAQPEDQEDGQLLVLEGRAWISERDMVRAQATLLRAVRAAPDLPEAYRWLGHVLLKRGDPQRALKTLHRALELDPKDEEARKLAVRAAHLSEAVEASESEPLADPTERVEVGARPERVLQPSPAPPRAGAGPQSRSLGAPAARAGGAPPIGAPKRVQPLASAGPGKGARANEPVAPSAIASALRAEQQNAAKRPLKAPMEEEPTSRFRRLTGRPSAPGSSGSIPAAVKPALPNPPDDPELGRYSAQNITAEQFVHPRALASSRAAASQPSSLRKPGRSMTPAGVRASAPAKPREELRAHRAEPPRGPSRMQPDPESARVTAEVPAQPQAPRTSPAPTPAAALPTWDEEDGVALLVDASLPPPAAEAAADRPIDADEALELVKRYGLFEEPRGHAGVQWATASEIEPRGTRVRNALIGLWVVTLLACAGGYFGWQAFVEQRHARAAAWVHDARALMLRGDHAGLVDAERLLRLAREQHPASSEIPLEALTLQVERVLEDGERDLAALKSALARAPQTTDGKAAGAAASAVIAAFGGDRALRDRLLDEALASASGDARRMFLLGRLEERLGRAQAREHIETASRNESKLVPARLALAAMAFDAGDRSDALARVDAVLAEHEGHLRAVLLRAFFSADDTGPKQLESTLGGLGEAMKLAGPVDELLYALAQARVARRKGQLDAASSAIERAAAASVDDPRLLSWVARESLALNKPALAQQAAGRALSVAPDVAPYRRLLAQVLIERGDGARARELLEKLPADDLEAQIMKAQSALLEDDEAALKAGLDALAQLPAKSDSAVLIGALEIRLESKLSPGKAVVDKAKALSRSAPGDPEALLALAEAGLAAHDPATASGALKQRFAVAPDDPNAHYLHGRARRMAADAEGAEASFRKALTLSPGQSDALFGLGGLLLDQGKYEEADAVFHELASRGGSAIAGRLGRVEALVSLGRLADAQVQLDAVPEAQRGSSAYRSAAARVALARGKPGEALSALRPLLETAKDKPALLALYGDALLAAEQLDAAADAYDKALALDSGLPEALLGRAEVRLRANQVKEALPVLEAAKNALRDRIRPPALHAQRLVSFGQAHVLRSKRGDLDIAKAALREATKSSAVPPAGYFWLAEALGGRGNPEARAAYQRYLELAPSGKYADRARRAL